MDADALLKAVTISCGGETGAIEPTFRSEAGELRDLRVIWLRHFDPTAVPIPGDDPAVRLFVRSEWEVLIRSLSCVGTGVRWVNHPEVVHRLDRLTQLRLARRVGFRIPSTLVSNDPERIASFVAQLPDKAVVKVLGNHFLEPTPGTLRGVFPRLISELDPEALLSAAATPSMYQEYVPHTSEVRATVVGRRVLAVEVEKTDPEDIWGRPENLSIRDHALPTKVEEKLRRYMRLGRLEFGAFDLLLTGEDDYTFLEVNLVGDWRWLESRHHGLDVTGVMASYIVESARRRAS